MSTKPFSKKLAEALFRVAGFNILNTVEITNQYSRSYDDPWVLVQTEFGVVMIGWRKRVINIDWTFCKYRGIITQDTVDGSTTKVSTADCWTHAWSYEKAVEYLSTLYLKMQIDR